MFYNTANTRKRWIWRFKLRNLGYQERLLAIEKELRETKINSSVSEVISKYDGNPTLLKPILTQAMKVDTNGAVSVEGKPLDEFVASLRENPEYGSAFYASRHSGGNSRPGGASGSGTPAKAMPKKTRSEMTPREQQGWVSKLGYAEYQKIPWNRSGL